MAHNCFLIIVRMVMIALIIGTSMARDLRPSEHGLEYSPPVEKKNSPGMKAFFGTSAAAVSKNTTSSGVALPRAMNSNDTSWWSGEGNGGGGKHVRHVLLVTSLACGVAGVCLLVVSGFIFFVRRKRQRTSSFRDDSGDASK